MAPSARTVVTAILVVAVGVMLLLDRVSLSLGKDYSSSSAVQKLAASASTESESSAPKQYRILCYGDSLTAGSSPPDIKVYPYAPFLEQALKDRGMEVVVRHRGLPGWTTGQMLSNLDDPRTGLRSALMGAIKQDPVAGISLVILLAGTNDLGYHQADEIATNVQQLNQVPYAVGVPRTLVLSVPPSGYQANNENAAKRAGRVNDLLEDFTSKEDRATFTASVPFPFERGGENWAPDTLHFSPRGYQVMGESLAPMVEQILATLN